METSAPSQGNAGATATPPAGHVTVFPGAIFTSASAGLAQTAMEADGLRTTFSAG